MRGYYRLDIRARQLVNKPLCLHAILDGLPEILQLFLRDADRVVLPVSPVLEIVIDDGLARGEHAFVIAYLALY